MGFAPGDAVHTRFGKGVVREMRNGGRVLVEVQGRAMVVPEDDLTPLDPPPRLRARAAPAQEPDPSPPSTRGPARRAAAEIDLHGLTVAEALARAEQALNDALLADAAELRLIHGRSGGRIRAALHRRLAGIPSVRGYRVDPANQGVTIVRF
jgi:DNA mismatch repair protein MutS2